MLQQYLPFTVLKLSEDTILGQGFQARPVATVPTVYGIETDIDKGENKNEFKWS